MTREERLEAYKQVFARRQKGELITKLLTEYGLDANKSGYYKWQADQKLNAPAAPIKRKYTKQKQAQKPVAPQLLTMQLPQTDTMTLIIGSSADVRFALEKLAAIHGA